MDNNLNLGDRLRYIRFKQNLSQEEVALRAGITTTYYGLVERNKKNPTVKILSQICDALNVEMVCLFDQTKPEPSRNDEYDEITLQIISHLNGRSDDYKKIILNIIKQINKI